MTDPLAFAKRASTLSSRWQSRVWTPTGGHSAWWLLVAPACLIAIGIGALWIDVPLTRWAITRQYGGALRDVFHISESFGHGIGIALFGVTIWILDPGRRWALVRLLGGAWGAGLAANCLKLLVQRTRPWAFYPPLSTVWDTFGGWLPLLNGGQMQQSFPSAHTASAAALALLLSCLYPRGKGLFATLAVLVAMQRVQCGAHFLSDCLGGAAVGWLFVLACMYPSRLNRWADRLEDRWFNASMKRQASHEPLHGPHSHRETQRQPAAVGWLKRSAGPPSE